MGSIRGSRDDGKLIAKVIQNNREIYDNGLSAMWEIVNQKNEDLYWTLRELHALTNEQLIENVPKEIRDYIEDYLQDNFPSWQKPLTITKTEDK